jgi:glycosyltransferase involved in cell wall biosynthesis
VKVLLVSDFYPPVRGGLEFHVEGLASELSAQGHEVHVATLTTDPTISDPRVTVHSVRTISASVLPHVDRSRPFHPPLPDPLGRRELRRLIDLIGPDVIHGHSWLTASLPRRRPPLVYTAHDYGLVCQLRTLIRPDESLCSGPAPAKCVACGARTYGWPTSMLLAPGTAAGRRLMQPDRVVAVSSAVARELRPAVRAPIEVIPNFVAAEAELAALPPGVLPEGDFVMFAGDPGPHKGLADLLAVWGSEEPPAAELLAATTRPLERSLPSRVRSTTLERGQVASAWAAAAVATVPSRWGEPCPTVVLEAMRAGTPVVAYAVGGIPDLIRDGHDGYLVEMGDRAALAQRITRLLATPALREQLAANARQTVTQFSAPVIGGRLAALYADLVAERRSARAGVARRAAGTAGPTST